MLGATGLQQSDVVIATPGGIRPVPWTGLGAPSSGGSSVQSRDDTPAQATGSSAISEDTSGHASQSTASHAGTGGQASGSFGVSIDAPA